MVELIYMNIIYQTILGLKKLVAHPANSIILLLYIIVKCWYGLEICGSILYKGKSKKKTKTYNLTKFAGG
jgi:hypothetical protein